MTTHSPQEALKVIASYTTKGIGPTYNRSRLSPDLNAFLELCLNVKPSKRATVDDLLESNFIAKRKDVNLSRHVSVAQQVLRERSK